MVIVLLMTAPCDSMIGQWQEAIESRWQAGEDCFEEQQDLRITGYCSGIAHPDILFCGDGDEKY